MQVTSLAAHIDASRNERQAATLHTAPCKITMLHLPAGHQLSKHMTPTAAVLFLHAGRARFHMAGDSVEMVAGDSVEIPAQAEHEVVSSEPSTFLLIR